VKTHKGHLACEKAYSGNISKVPLLATTSPNLE